MCEAISDPSPRVFSAKEEGTRPAAVARTCEREIAAAGGDAFRACRAIRPGVFSAKEKGTRPAAVARTCEGEVAAAGGDALSALEAARRPSRADRCTR